MADVIIRLATKVISMRLNQLIYKAVLGLVLYFLPGTVLAVQTTSSLPLSVNVVGICEVNTNPIVFVGYDGLSEVTAQGAVIVQCSNDLSYQVALDAGLNFGLGHLSGLRAMSDGYGNYISYQLFDPGFSVEWGDTGYASSYTAGLTVRGVGDGYDQILVVNGRLPDSGQSIPPGNYNDIVTVTIHF